MNKLQQYVYNRTAAVLDDLNEPQLNVEIIGHNSIDKNAIPSGINAKRELLKELTYSYIEQASDNDLQTVYPDFVFDYNNGDKEQD